jgi:hypothetical protein
VHELHSPAWILTEAAIQVTDSPRVAAQLATTLAPQAPTVNPRVALPPQWVRRNLRRVTTATWALRNCSDPALLEEVAATDHRTAVRLTLLANPHLPLSSRTALRRSLATTHSPTSKVARLAHLAPPTSLSDYLERYFIRNLPTSTTSGLPRKALSEEKLYELARIIQEHKGTNKSISSTLDQALLQLASLGCVPAVRDYTFYYYGLLRPLARFQSAITPSPWVGATLHPVDLLEKLRPRQVESVLTILVASCIDSTVVLPSVQFDARMASLMKATYGLLRAPVKSPILTNWYTPQALVILLGASPAWDRHLLTSQMTLPQATSLVKRLTGEGDGSSVHAMLQARRTYAKGIAPNDPRLALPEDSLELLSITFDTDLARAQFIDACITFKFSETALACLCPGDPRVQKIIDTMRPDYLGEFIRGEMKYRDNTSHFPGPSDLPAILEKMAATGWIRASEWPYHFKGSPSNEYLDALTELVPQVLQYLAHNPTTASYLARLLLSVTEDFPLAVAVLRDAPKNAPLSRILTTIQALDCSKNLRRPTRVAS